MTVSLPDVFCDYLRKVVIAGVDHTELLECFVFRFVVFLLIELAVRKVIDVNAIIFGV